MLNLATHNWFAKCTRKWLAEVSNLAKQADSRSQPGQAESPQHYIALILSVLLAIILIAVWYWQKPQPDSSVAWLDIPLAQYETAAETADSPYRLSQQSINTLPQPNLPDQEHIAWHAAEVTPATHELSALNQLHTAQNARNASQGASQNKPAQASKLEASRKQIFFAVDADSWLEVRDGNGAQLIHRMAYRGQRLTLEGRPPFSVFIGNADGVQVAYSGKPVRFTAPKLGLFARFKVGFAD